MDRLSATIELHSRWKGLSEYVLRIKTYRESDFPLCIENSKALIETIAKEICKQKGKAVAPNEPFGRLLKTCFDALGYDKSAAINQIGGGLSNIAYQLGDLRNEIGSTSHGKTLDELRVRKDKIDKTTGDFLILSTELVACFLIELIETEAPSVVSKTLELKIEDYPENEDFNEYFDDTWGDVKFGAYSFLPSEVLYKLDYISYESELINYREYPDEDNGE